MKLVTFEKEGHARVGAVADGAVVDLSTCSVAYDDMLSFLEAGEAALKEAASTLAAAAGGKRECVYALDEVKLLAPVPVPGKLFCLAGNYVKHIEEGRAKFKLRDKVTPRLFLKPSTNTVIGPGAPIVIPQVARAIDWEAELAVVIGRRGKNIRREEAYDYVAGYTAMNDVSERDLRIRERLEAAEWDSFFDWLNGKWLDSFAPMGPWIVTADEIPDPHSLRISLSVNGRMMQDSGTANMIHRVDELIEYVSTIVTLAPGDVIATGTPEGTGHPKGLHLAPGDTVRIEIEKIGVLENPVEAE